MDISGLKSINDKLGYHNGDKILQEFAQRLKNSFRSADIVCRWGGDEFAILLSQINDPEDAQKICQRILPTLNQEFKIEQTPVELKSHIGLSTYPQDGGDEVTLLKIAETNLILKKQKTRQQSREEHLNVQAQAKKLSKVEYLLQQALNKKEFCLYYQPEINLKTGEVDSMEALLRWNHPQLGLVAPNQFISWVEKTDLVIPISRWVVETACKQAYIWHKAGFTSLPISINLSPKEIQQPELPIVLKEVLSSVNLNPSLLMIEITEATLMQNTEATFRLLYELKQMGIGVAMDDFGTGYTSVSHLQQFPFNKLKIAQTLIQGLKYHPEETGMIAAVIALGRTFNMEVVAEGVETPEQLKRLRELGCVKMQGYRFSQPLTVKDATQFLSIHHTSSPQG